MASFQLFAFYAVSTPGVQITNCVPYKGFKTPLNGSLGKEGLQQPCNLEEASKKQEKMPCVFFRQPLSLSVFDESTQFYKLAISEFLRLSMI